MLDFLMVQKKRFARYSQIGKRFLNRLLRNVCDDVPIIEYDIPNAHRNKIHLFYFKRSSEMISAICS